MKGSHRAVEKLIHDPTPGSWWILYLCASFDDLSLLILEGKELKKKKKKNTLGLDVRQV